MPSIDNEGFPVSRDRVTDNERLRRICGHSRFTPRDADGHEQNSNDDLRVSIADELSLLYSRRREPQTVFHIRSSVSETQPSNSNTEPLKDKENGEIVKQKFIVLRKSSSQSRTNGNALQSAFPLVKQHQQFSGFRIREALQQNELKLRKGNSFIYNRNYKRFTVNDFQSFIHVSSGLPVQQYLAPPHNLRSYIKMAPNDDYRKTSCFRVPVELLPAKVDCDEPLRNPKSICINIWEEFSYGVSVLSCYKPPTLKEKLNITTVIREYLKRILPSVVVDFISYFFFFLAFFSSCLLYNHFLELGCYFLLAGHLEIHEMAHKSNIDIIFTGSPFQGPAYVFVRAWCEHCNHKEREKVVLRLMKTMRKEILEAQTKHRHSKVS